MTPEIIAALRAYEPTGRMGRLMHEAADELEKQQAAIAVFTWTLNVLEEELK